MRSNLSLTAATATLLATLTAAVPLQPRQSFSSTFSLYVNGTGLGTFQDVLEGYKILSYANDTAFIGHIAQKVYAEPLRLRSAGGYGLAFTSYHDPYMFGNQDLYVVPNVTGPLGFSPQGQSPPVGTVAQGFSFDNAAGALTVNGENKFMACQSVAESEIESWEIWWHGDGEPNGVSCLVDIQLLQVPGCGV